MGVVFDTGVWVGLASEQLSDLSALKKAENSSVFMSVISLGELAFGVESCVDAPERARRSAVLRQIESLPMLNVTKQTSLAFGLLAAAVKQGGRSPRPRFNDLWIAAQSIEHGFELFTTNPKDFHGLPGLKLVAV